MLEHAFVTDKRVLKLYPWCNDHAQVVVLPKSYPTTKLCRECGRYNDELGVGDKIFKCSCGVVEDRDVHAARNMVWLFDNIVQRGTVGTVGSPLNYKRVELESLVNKVLVEGNRVLVKKHEAPGL